MAGTSSLRVLAVDELEPTAVEQWRAWQVASPRLRAPTLSLAYLQLLATNRSDVRVLELSTDGATAYLGAHQAKTKWVAAGLLFNDCQGLIRNPAHGRDADFLALLPELTFGSWRPDPASREASDQHVTSTGYAIDLQHGLDAYTQDRRRAAPDHLKKIRRRLRALEQELGPVRLEWPCSSPAARQQLLQWKSAQFRRTGRHDILSSRWLQGFISNAFDADHVDCKAELAALFAGDTLVAAEIGFTGFGVNQSWLAAYDQAFARFGTGTLLLQHVIDAAPARGIHRIDLGPGHGSYKEYFANETYTALSGRVVTRNQKPRAPDMAALSAWAERQRFPGSRLPGKALRRYAMIEACEPSLIGRARGVLTAIGSANWLQRSDS